LRGDPSPLKRLSGSGKRKRALAVDSVVADRSGDEVASGGVGGLRSHPEEPPVADGAKKDELAIKEGWNSNGGGSGIGEGDKDACRGLVGGGGGVPSGEGRGIEPESGDRGKGAGDGGPDNAGLTDEWFVEVI